MQGLLLCTVHVLGSIMLYYIVQETSNKFLAALEYMYNQYCVI